MNAAAALIRATLNDYAVRDARAALARLEARAAELEEWWESDMAEANEKILRLEAERDAYRDALREIAEMSKPTGERGRVEFGSLMAAAAIARAVIARFAPSAPPAGKETHE